MTTTSEGIKKSITEKRLTYLENTHRRWTKTGWNGKVYDRIYFDLEKIGLEISYYKTGNVREARIDGKTISNSEAKRIFADNCYYDIVRDEIVMGPNVEYYFKDAIEHEVYGDYDDSIA